MPKIKTAPKTLTVHCDGGCSANRTPEGQMYYSFAVNGQRIVERQDLGHGTNNQAEYLALLEAARHITRAGVQVKVNFLSDSALIVNQVLGRWKINDPALRLLRSEFVELMSKSAGVVVAWSIGYVPRQEIVSMLGH